MDGMNLDYPKHVEALEEAIARNAIQIIRLETGIRQLDVENRELKDRLASMLNDSENQ